MAKALIKIAYQQTMDALSLNNDFEKACFHSSYEEFLMKSQAYNLDGKSDSFTELKANDGRAHSLHYKTGFAVSGYIGLLNKQIPTLRNSLGEPVLFDTYRFELIESSITDRSKHKFAIHFITGTLTLIDSFGSSLLLAYNDQSAGGLIEGTFILELKEGLGIISYQR